MNESAPSGRPDAGYTKTYHKWTDDDGLSDSAYRTLVTIYSLWNPSTERWMSPPTVANVAKIRRRHVENVRLNFRELEEAGYIKRAREFLIGGGSRMFMEIVLPTAKNPLHREDLGNSNSISEPSENTVLPNPVKTLPSEPRANTVLTNPAQTLPSIMGNNGFKNEDKTKEQNHQSARVLACEASPESEPLASPDDDFVSVSQSPLLIPNGYTAKPMRGQVVLTQAQANLAAQLLGASGEDIKAHLIFTPEQSAKEGFIECCLKTAIDRRKSIKGSAFAYLRGIVAGNWNDGKWVDPAIEAERAKQAEKDARAERLRRLKEIMK